MKNINVKIEINAKNISVSESMNTILDWMEQQQEEISETQQQITKYEEDLCKGIGGVKQLKALLLKQVRQLKDLKTKYEEAKENIQDNQLDYFIDIDDLTDELDLIEEFLEDVTPQTIVMIKEKKERMTTKKRAKIELDKINFELQVFYNIKLKDGVWQPAIVERVKELEAQREEVEKILNNN
jgi:hypothetical protein